jgi:hypothetical protein
LLIESDPAQGKQESDPAQGKHESDPAQDNPNLGRAPGLPTADPSCKPIQFQIKGLLPEGGQVAFEQPPVLFLA